MTKETRGFSCAHISVDEDGAGRGVPAGAPPDRCGDVGAEDLRPEGHAVRAGVQQLEDAGVSEAEAGVEREAPPPGLEALDLAAPREAHPPGAPAPRHRRRRRGRREERRQRPGDHLRCTQPGTKHTLQSRELEGDDSRGAEWQYHLERRADMGLAHDAREVGLSQEREDPGLELITAIRSGRRFTLGSCIRGHFLCLNEH